MKINEAVRASNNRVSILLSFLNNHPNEVFMQGELQENNIQGQVRNYAPMAYRFIVGNKTWYGVPSALKSLKKELEKEVIKKR